MSTPKVTVNTGGYLFTWEQEHILIKVTRLHVHNDGRVTGEILITSNAEGYTSPLYPQSQLNFSATRTRNEIAKHLKESYPDWDWPILIDQLAYQIQELAREGEPVQELWTSDDIKPPEFLLAPILYKGLPTIIFGEKAVCKSTISLVLYTCLTLPWHDNPLGLKAPPRSVPTILLDYEADYEVAQWNAKKIQEGMELGPIFLLYRRCSLPFADDVEQIQNIINKYKAEVIIVDSLGPAVGGDLKDPGQALRFTTAIRQLKCASIIIGQTSKDKETKHKSVYGSTFFEYYARNIFELRKEQEEGTNEVDLALFNTYCNLGSRAIPLGFKVKFSENGTGTLIEPQDIRTVPEFLDSLSAGPRILVQLKNGKLTAKELSEKLDLKYNTIDHSLKRLKDKGKVQKFGEKWGLIYEDDNENHSDDE